MMPNSRRPRLLLVSPPWQTPYSANLALATLRPLLQAQGIECDELHGTLLFPYTQSPQIILESFANYLFAPYLYPQLDRQTLLDKLVQRCHDYGNLGGVIYSPEEFSSARSSEEIHALRGQLFADFDRAGVCLDRMVAAAIDPRYDIVGFSVTFEVQLPAALVVARRIKQARPDMRVILGGAACVETQGDGLAASFPFLDAVCHTEGEAVIGPLVRVLRGEGELATVPGISYVDASGALRHNPSPAHRVDLDTLPIPQYQPFIEQFEASPWRPMGPPKFFFETSRGCWWGQKHLCTFCGLNAEGLTFRRKSPERAYLEISHLYNQYQAHYLQATDNIMDMAYFKEVMPKLAAMPKQPGRPLSIFFEIKSNLRRDQIWALKDGGITYVQPGIESFSDSVLQLMDKGATGLGQIQFIKWAFEAGIGLVYNLIFRNPGEQASWYREMEELIPALVHLPPPTGLVNMHLERFSPYQSRPEEFGIRNLRPLSYYADLFPDPQVDLNRIAYNFAYEHDTIADPELAAAHRACARLVTYWKNTWNQQLASYVERAGCIVISDRRKGNLRPQAMLSGRAAELFRYLDRVRSWSAIQRRFPSIDEDILRSLLASWQRLGWICRTGDRYLSVLPCRERRPIEPETEPREKLASRRLPLLQADPV